MSYHENMPEPVEVWLGELGHGFAVAPGAHFPGAIGPYKIVPHMMSLDELHEKNIIIMRPPGHVYWQVWHCDGMVQDAIPTALEAQWAATCLAKKNVDHAETDE